MCADLVNVEWTKSTHVANLEDISPEGACIQLETPIPAGASVRVVHKRGEVRGVVRYCVFREVGYFVGIEFEAGSKWSSATFKPDHLFDPTQLANEPRP